MKILLFSTGYIDCVMIDLANALAKLEETVLMLPENHMVQRHHELISDSVTFEPYHLPRYRNIRSMSLMRTVVKIVKKHDPDVLHLQDGGHPWFFLAFPFLAKYPVVNTIHDPRPHMGEERFWKGFVMRKGQKHTNHYIVHGERMRELMMEYYGLDEETIDVIPLGVADLHRNWNDCRYETERNNILYFGRIWKYKGLENLVRAESMIAERIGDFKITIAGTGEDVAKYKSLMNDSDNFEWKNYRIENDEIVELFQKASVVVLPYIEGTQSAVVPLAYAFGKPVVVTKVGSIHEEVVDGKTGFIVPPNNERALAARICEILLTQEGMESMGREIKQKANGDLSWSRIAKMTLKTYRKVGTPSIREKST